MIKYLTLILAITSISSKCGTLNDTRCQSCLVAETCASCYQSYWDATEKKCVVPPTTISNCRHYKNANTCEDCELGYFLKSSTSCEKITITGCIYQEKAEECESCGEHKVSTDLKSCTEDDCSISNCKYCMTNSGIQFCTYCDDGYAASALLTSCVSNDKYCSHLDQEGKCNRCQEGHYMNGDSCDSSSIIPHLDDHSDGVNSLFVFAVGFFALFI